jgi:hypothetical protein
MGMLEQIGFHPWPAILGGIAGLLNLFLLITRPRGGRVWLLPAIASFSCTAVAAGVLGSAWTTIEGLRAMALTGSGGQGSLAAVLAEARSTFVAGPAAAALVTATGLLLARSEEDTGAMEGASGSSLASQLRAFLALSALMAALVAGLSVYDLWFTGSLPQRVLGSDAKPGVAADLIASHLVRLSILSGLGLAASAILTILSSRLATVDWPPRSLVRWGRALLLVFLILAVAGAAVARRQQARFMEAAMTGQLR